MQLYPARPSRSLRKARGVTGPSSSTQTTVQESGAGRCRAGSSTFGTSSRIGALSPRWSRPGANAPLGCWDAPHLAASLPASTHRPGRPRLRPVQCPVGCLLVFGPKHAVGAGEQLPAGLWLQSA